MKIIKTLALLGLAAAPVAYAQPSIRLQEGAAEAPAESAGEKAAKDTLTKYLTAVKAKKWAEAKKFLHPKTVSAIADRKKRMGKEEHAMAPWAAEKTDSYLKEYRLQGSKGGPNGTFVIEISEDNFQVQEKGLSEGDMASYLVGKSGGKWFVVDKRRQETFPDSSIKASYKGWFDEAPKAAETPAE